MRRRVARKETPSRDQHTARVRRVPLATRRPGRSECGDGTGPVVASRHWLRRPDRGLTPDCRLLPLVSAVLCLFVLTPPRSTHC